VGTFGVVVDAPFLNDYLSFLETVEDFAIQTFVPELAVEGFAVAVLPR
jgi:hypothetical protein